MPTHQKKPTPQPGAQKRASSEGQTHQKKLLQKKLLHNQLLKKELNIKGQLTKKATSQPANPKSRSEGPTHPKKLFLNLLLQTRNS